MPPRSLGGGGPASGGEAGAEWVPRGGRCSGWGEGFEQHAMERRPIPRVDGRSLGYLRFLREFALPGLPVILTGLGGDWRATTAWRPPKTSRLRFEMARVPADVSKRRAGGDPTAGLAENGPTQLVKDARGRKREVGTATVGRPHPPGSTRCAGEDPARSPLR